jgi:hypothetical protein
MRLAVMQPYFVPYIGYWQLIAAVDTFVVYDDVNYIKRGWVNRNRILANGSPNYLTIPVFKASQNSKICDLDIADDSNWRGKAKKKLEHSYSKAPFFEEAFPIAGRVLDIPITNLSGYLTEQLKIIADVLDLKTNIVRASDRYTDRNLEKADRLISICKDEGAKTYINSPGGRALYSKEYFGAEDIDLFFIDAEHFDYTQSDIEKFVPHLSILDVLFHCGVDRTKELTQLYRLS